MSIYLSINCSSRTGSWWWAWSPTKEHRGQQECIRSAIQFVNRHRGARTRTHTDKQDCNYIFVGTFIGLTLTVNNQTKYETWDYWHYGQLGSSCSASCMSSIAGKKLHKCKFQGKILTPTLGGVKLFTEPICFFSLHSLNNNLFKHMPGVKAPPGQQGEQWQHTRCHLCLAKSRSVPV